jgi:tetratricopeptide (TPR) repeat protein
MKYLALLILALSLAWTAGGQDAAYWQAQAVRDYFNGSYSFALDDIENYLEMNSSDINGWNTKAEILLKMRRYGEAEECLDMVIALDGSNVKAWNDKGLIRAGALGDREGGLESLDRATEIDPSYAHGWYNRGLILEEMKRYDESLESLTRATELDPSLAKAWLHQGRVLMNQGNSQAAAGAFERAVEPGTRGA